MKQTLAIALTLAISVTSAVAQDSPKPGSPGANFRDDVLLEQAKSDVRRMYRHELDLLTDTLATCFVTDLVKDDVANRQCEITYQRYEVAYGDDRPINAVLAAQHIVAELVRLEPDPPKNAQRRAEIGEDIFRLVTLYRQLSHAISSRNRELAKP
jgi:hypothetical protein